MTKPKLSDTIAIIALFVSLISLYFSGFYQVRDLSVTWGVLDLSRVDEKYQLPVPLVFMNKGTRTEAITRVRIKIGEHCYSDDELSTFSILPNSNKVISISQKFDKKRISFCTYGDKNDITIEVDYVSADGKILKKKIIIGNIGITGQRGASWPVLSQELPHDESADEDVQVKERNNKEYKPVDLSIYRDRDGHH